MRNQSIATLPAERSTDLLSVSRSLQTVVDTTNKLIGVSGVQQSKTLSRLEKTEDATLGTLNSLTTEALEQRKLVKTIRTNIAQFDLELTQLEERISQLEQAQEFSNLPSDNFDAAGWGSYNGKVFGARLGSALSNPPTGVTLSGSATYQVFGEIASNGAYKVTVQLIGNSQNRIFVRAGSSFANAISNGWKEL